MALLVNLGLVALFGLQHSVMARPAFKRWSKGFVAPSVERSTFVLATSLVLALIYWQWRPMTAVVWDVAPGLLANLLWTMFAAGFLLGLLATFVIDHFDLFGLRQVTLNLLDRPYHHAPFQVRYFYRFIRHPIYLGLLLAFWATPHMTVGHLVFALGMTAYIFIGVRFEERDLERFLVVRGDIPGQRPHRRGPAVDRCAARVLRARPRSCRQTGSAADRLARAACGWLPLRADWPWRSPAPPCC